ncbi:hypothetical protein FIBSPDRAFT_722178 [Athelia psychrophila]|uniref:Uncharacterized protein n=1 Tax=Athelia psychrophila TaxID=1759441 RepID=A0A166VIL5_9AGAM|nr:hypothetical protein FIBSPDRAFT_722178 [Fibularhizoctonia sp. CBS 109695]
MLCTESDHLDCNPHTPNNTGCLRCIVRKPQVCCELCDPATFKDFARVDVEGRKCLRRNRAHVPKYDTQPHDMQLRKALHQFRKDETIKTFNLATLKNLGPSIVMSNKTLDRIVDCAHIHKITTISQLKHETQWSRADTYGVAVIALIVVHSPSIPPVPARAPAILIQPSPTNGLVTPVTAITPKKCSSCKALGHISTLFCYQTLPTS